jgi:putative DNA primase/helicase
MAAIPEGLTTSAVARPPPSAPFTGADRKLGAPTATYLYQDLEGRLFYQCRYQSAPAPEDGEAGGKTYRPWVWSADKQTWVSRGPAQPTPLYHLDLLQQRTESLVYVVEGEKCADAWQTMLTAAGHQTVAVSGWGGCASIKNARWEAIAGRKVILWPDNDEVGRNAMAWLAGRLLSLRCKVSVINVPRGTKPDHWDVADAIDGAWTYEQVKAFIQENLQEVTQAPPTVVELSEARAASKTKAAEKSSRKPAAVPQDDGQTDAWRHWGLDCKSTGFPWENTENVCRVLAKLHEGETFGKIWYDEFAVRIMTAGDPQPRAWEDADTISLQCFLQATLGMKRIHKHIVHDGVIRHARAHTVNPVREWLKSLKWDGAARLEDLLTEGWGVQADSYSRAVSRCFLVGAVARIMRPGCQVDTMPVFEGGQGIGKTSALRALAGMPWHDEPTYRLGDRDFYLCMAGKWILELSEMAQLKGVALETAKAVITRREDRFRAPFERLPSTHPRMCVFAATTNKDDWNADETGARRFLPVRCGRLDVEWIHENREQLFAEALVIFDEGGNWWEIPADRAKFEQDERQLRDAWHDEVEFYLRTKSFVRLEDIYRDVCDVPKHLWNPELMRRVRYILQSLKWCRSRRRINGDSDPQRGWRAPSDWLTPKSDPDKLSAF